ncbi:hypothetical protein SNE40_009519 [Patella caerulea]|uniref:Uncharacterized protein n=1 Tax=Patella caerulea TaxID=87958 RepID=A0AAN8PQC4_PATCE
MESSKTEHRAVIMFVTKDAAQYSTFAKWSAEIKRGCSSLDDDPRLGRPVEAITDDMVARLQGLIMSDPRIKVDEISSECGISHGSDCTLIHEHLHMTKVYAKWGP